MSQFTEQEAADQSATKALDIIRIEQATHLINQISSPSDNSKQRSSVMSNIYQFCDQSIENVNALDALVKQQLLDNQEPNKDRGKIYLYKDLSSKIEDRYGSTDFLSLRLLFEPHTLNGSSAYKEERQRIIEEGKQVFVLGEANIVLLEEGKTGKQRNAVFDKWFQKYGNFTEAYLYGLSLANYKRPPNEAEFTEVLAKALLLK